MPFNGIYIYDKSFILKYVRIYIDMDAKKRVAKYIINMNIFSYGYKFVF